VHSAALELGVALTELVRAPFMIMDRKWQITPKTVHDHDVGIANPAFRPL
jgi:hypothetical protein